MKKVIVIIIFLITLASLYVGQKAYRFDVSKKANSETSTTIADTAEIIERSDRFVERKRVFTYNRQTIQYLLIFPAEYTQTAKRWPMILFLHGSSLKGQDLDLVKSYGPSWVAEQTPGFSFVVLAPQCPEGEDWMDKPDILAALLDDVFKKYRIDQDRVYLTGTSMGGNGTWHLACLHPEYFAAIAPLASNPAVPASWNKQMISMPVWAFHGDADPICPLKNDKTMIDALRGQGGNPRLTILPGQGHNIAGVYKNRELYDWFLTYIRQ